MSNQIRHYIVVDKPRAKEMIVKAFTDARAHRGRAAEKLGVKQHTLLRWARILKLEATLEKIEERAKREGWHHGRTSLSPGRPPKAATS